MKDRDDLVRGWLRKAESDFLALTATLSAGAYDTACFHAQQAAEKYLKAYLDYRAIEYPFTHNLAKLVELCQAIDSAFANLIAIVEPLTPYAVESRYDADFWPERDIAEEASALAQSVRVFVFERLPGGIRPDRKT